MYSLKKGTLNIFGKFKCDLTYLSLVNLNAISHIDIW